MNPREVLYRSSGNNSILRLTLWEVWGGRCYWCKDPKELKHVEIDHMIPRTFSRTEVADVLANVLSPEIRPDPFNINAPHNLAPICRPCNDVKADKDFTKTPKFMSLLRRAIESESRVVETVRKFYKRNAFTKAMSVVVDMDESDPEVMETLVELGLIFVNRLRYIAPAVLEGPSNYEFSGPMADEMSHVAVTLDGTARRARVVLEDGYGCDFDEVLGQVGRAVTSAIKGLLSEVIAGELTRKGYDPDVGPAEGWIDIAIDRLVQEVGDQNFECGGTYEAAGSAFAAIQDPRSDSGTDVVQRETDIRGRFIVTFWLVDGSDVEVGDVEWVEARRLGS